MVGAVRRDLDDLTAQPFHQRGVFAHRVNHDDAILRNGKKNVQQFTLGSKALAAARGSKVQAVGGFQLFAVSHDDVMGQGVHAVVEGRAIHAKLPRHKGNEDGRGAGGHDIPGKTISFSKGMIMNMLSNERYCGDAILQKSVTVDCIEKKRKKNTGEAPMYYVQNNHPAIIDRVTFNKVQEELARRKTKTPGSAKSSITSTGKYSRYALTDVLICGNCGTRYRRVTWSRNGTKRIVWRCISRLDYGKKYCSDSPTIMEDKLQEAIVRAVNKFNKQDNATYKALMRATISEALGLNGDPEEVDMLERKIEALNNKMLALVNESVSSGDGIEAHESEFMTLSQEAELLKQRIAAIQESTAKDNGEQNRLEQIQAIIAERESKCMEYDDSIVRQMVECIKVYPGGKLEIIFGGGYLVEESV